MEEIFRGGGTQHRSFHSWTSRVQCKGGFDLLAAEEPLADVENQLMVRWLLQGSKGNKEDVRYILRSIFHTADLKDAYDFIFLDCPPRLTTACVNALACSDHVLIPVLPDERSTEAVPRLLKVLKTLGNDVWPDLSVLGIVANRTYGSFNTDQLAVREKPAWISLPAKCRLEWPGPIHYCKASIKQFTNEADKAAQKHQFVVEDTPPRPGQKTFGDAFDDLAGEMLGVVS